jgi:hypothetical protein
VASQTNEVGAARIDRSSAEWRGLLAKLLEDFTGVVQGEAKPLRASVEAALETAVVGGLRHMILAVMALYGVLCLIGVGVLFLYNWIEWRTADPKGECNAKCGESL